MHQVSQTIASIAWYGWVAISLAWMFIGAGVAEISIRSAERDVDRSRVKPNGRRIYKIKEHKPSLWTLLMFPSLYINGWSDFCEARDYGDTNYRIWMVLIGPIKIAWNVVSLSGMLASYLVVELFKALLWLLRAPWRIIFNFSTKQFKPSKPEPGKYPPEFLIQS
jgi:hypothetical protein